MSDNKREQRVFEASWAPPDRVDLATRRKSKHDFDKLMRKLSLIPDGYVEAEKLPYRDRLKRFLPQLVPAIPLALPIVLTYSALMVIASYLIPGAPEVAWLSLLKVSIFLFVVFLAAIAYRTASYADGVAKLTFGSIWLQIKRNRYFALLICGLILFAGYRQGESAGETAFDMVSVLALLVLYFGIADYKQLVKANKSETARDAS